MIRNKYAHDLRYELAPTELQLYDIDNKLLNPSSKLKKYSMKSNARSLCLLIQVQLRNHLLEKLKIDPRMD